MRDSSSLTNTGPSIMPILKRVPQSFPATVSDEFVSVVVFCGFGLALSLWIILLI
jgi:hypothetical protein